MWINLKKISLFKKIGVYKITSTIFQNIADEENKQFSIAEKKIESAILRVWSQGKEISFSLDFHGSPDTVDWRKIDNILLFKTAQEIQAFQWEDWIEKYIIDDVNISLTGYIETF